MNSILHPALMSIHILKPIYIYRYICTSCTSVCILLYAKLRLLCEEKGRVKVDRWRLIVLELVDMSSAAVARL